MSNQATAQWIHATKDEWIHRYYNNGLVVNSRCNTQYCNEYYNGTGFDAVDLGGVKATISKMDLQLEWFAVNERQKSDCLCNLLSPTIHTTRKRSTLHSLATCGYLPSDYLYNLQSRTIHTTRKRSKPKLHSLAHLCVATLVWIRRTFERGSYTLDRGIPPSNVGRAET